MLKLSYFLTRRLHIKMSKRKLQGSNVTTSADGGLTASTSSNPNKDICEILLGMSYLSKFDTLQHLVHDRNEWHFRAGRL